MEVLKVFPEGPLSISMHPSGLQVIVGFQVRAPLPFPPIVDCVSHLPSHRRFPRFSSSPQDKLRLMNILMDDLRDVCEFPIKACQEVRRRRGGEKKEAHCIALAARARPSLLTVPPRVRFSHGGQFFAAANHSVITVFDTYTAACVQTLRGHSARITQIAWAFNDATLLSCGVDGALYEWDMRDGKRSRECLLKGSRFFAVAAHKDGSVALAVGARGGRGKIAGGMRV